MSQISLAKSDADLIELAKHDFSIKQEIRYATKNNFMKERVYSDGRCILRREVAQALARVQTTLKMDGLGLKVWDCYRPLSVQQKLWNLVKDERYVSDPKKGSKHNRGAAVDVTLVDRSGNELEMPSFYDDFSEKAHRDYEKAPRAAIKNRERLAKAMAKEGFIGIPTEWWHFDHQNWEKYPLENKPFSDISGG